MKHVKLFENMSNPRGLGEIEIADGVGMMVYDCNDMAFMKELYEEFMPAEQTFEEFVEQMSTPGIYNESEYGGPFEVIEINSRIFRGIDPRRFRGDSIRAMLYTF